MESPLAAFAREISALAGRTAPAVVAIRGRRHAHSSGVHWRKDLVVTAEHTLRRDEDITVSAGSGTEGTATLVGRDPGTDIALLKLEGLGVPTAQTGPHALPAVGDIALVIGRSPNSGTNAAMGMIGAVSGPWRTWRGGELDAYIRLDATVFAGSSGGAVVDQTGSVTGIATSALSRVAGLAIPASTVNRVVDQLLAKGSVPRPYLGVGLHAVPMPEQFRTKFGVERSHGIMILEVEPQGPADRGGILSGDIVLEIRGQKVGAVEDVQSALGWETVGKPVQVKLIRGGELKEITITVGERSRGAAS
ncbi:MAG TPA: S1C family serine protease [Bacteroidota bacterium]|nr:S1C family serine protease [Bacteroidota bacterium]